jgi:hypothetical protein
MFYVILQKAKPYTRTRKGKLERVKGSPYRLLGMDEWYEKHKEELWGARKKRHGYQSMKKTKKEKAWFGKGTPGSEMAGFSSASFASANGTVGRENWPPQPLLNYSAKKKKLKRKKGSITEVFAPFMGGGSGWVMA